MTKYYVEIDLDVDGEVIAGERSSHNSPGFEDYVEDFVIDTITFDHKGRTFNLLEGLSREAMDQIKLNLSDALYEEIAQVILMGAEG